MATAKEKREKASWMLKYLVAEPDQQDISYDNEISILNILPPVLRHQGGEEHTY